MQAAGKKSPLDYAPTLEPGLGFYLSAFQSLRNDRPVGMGIGPIPWTAIARYAEVYRLDLDELDDLEHYVRAMEEALAKHDQQKTDQKGASA